jgi:hypothetical protein
MATISHYNDCLFLEQKIISLEKPGISEPKPEKMLSHRVTWYAGCIIASEVTIIEIVIRIIAT